MRLLPLVLLIFGMFNCLTGVPILFFGKTFFLEKAMPDLMSSLENEGNEQLKLSYSLMFGSLAMLLGVCRMFCGFETLTKTKSSRGLYLVMCVTFALEIARDAQLSASGEKQCLFLNALLSSSFAPGFVDKSQEWLSIIPNILLLGWCALVMKFYT